MRTITVFAAAFAALTPTVMAGECKFEYLDHGNAARRFYITASGLDSVTCRCGGLWDNMNRFSQCATLSNTYCGEGENPGDLEWHFNAATICDEGMIESTWWEATRDEFGALDGCENVGSDGGSLPIPPVRRDVKA